MAQHENIGEIVWYLKSTEALRGVEVEDIVHHLFLLKELDQMELIEDDDGNMVYSWAWYLVDDDGLAKQKRGEMPDRFDKGCHMIGLYGYNKTLRISEMKKIIRERVEKTGVDTFSIYTPRKKWITYKKEGMRCRQSQQ